jgi:tRNA(Arg) A34 adenosine deaminase TadA
MPKKTNLRTTADFRLHRRWLGRAEAVAHKPVAAGGSPHPTVKVGAALVGRDGRLIAAAANRFADGVKKTAERLQVGKKSLWLNCAEQMALAQALKKRADVKGAGLYVTLEPCAVCAGLICELGIREVFVPANAMRRVAHLKPKWKQSIAVGIEKLAEAGVDLVIVPPA